MTQSKPKSVAELFGLPDPPRTGRERLIATAVDLFYRHGFGAIGVDRVIEAAGVTKTTFYKHFEGKDDLMVAAVQRRDEWESQAWNRAVRKIAGDDPAGQLLAMIDVMDLWFNDPDFRGCMFTNTATEFPNPHDPVHQAAAAYKLKKASLAPAILPKAAGIQRDGGGDVRRLFLRGDRGRDGSAAGRRERNDAARAIPPGRQLLIRDYLRTPLESAFSRIEATCAIQSRHTCLLNCSKPRFIGQRSLKRM